MDEDTRKLLELKIAQTEKQGHGEIKILVRNGAVYRLLTTEDTLVSNKQKEA